MAFSPLVRGDRYHYYDLGEAWQRSTGLPFVFALWAINPNTANPDRLANLLRSWMEAGITCLDEIIAEQPLDFQPEARRYLREHISFEMQSADREGLALYGPKLFEHGLISKAPGNLTFV